MDSWLTYTDYQERCPDTTLPEAEFRQLAAKAALEIEGATHWRAVLAALPEEISQLAECQAQLVTLMCSLGGDSAAQASLSGVTSVNNHGYSESYAAAQSTQAAIQQQQDQLILRVLSAPATRWMIYAGAVYHPPRRR